MVWEKEKQGKERKVGNEGNEGHEEIDLENTVYEYSIIMATKMLYAWYSPTQKKYWKQDTKSKNSGLKYSSFIYLNTDGNEVEVTEVCSDHEFISYFKDFSRKFRLRLRLSHAIITS